MHWSYTLFLPAAVCFVFPILMVMFRKRMTTAQVMTSITMIMEGFTMMVIGIAFAREHGSTFIYDYVFKVMTLLCIGFFYISVCSLTEPKGPTLRQRQVMWVPLLYTVGISVAGSTLGPRRYNDFCNALFEYDAHFVAGDTAWNNMLIWSFFVFYSLTLIVGVVVVIMASRKLAVFKGRLNGIYAENHDLPKMSLRYIMLHMWGLCSVCLAYFFIIVFAPQHIEAAAWPLAIALTVTQLSLCVFICKAKYDARYLNTLIGNK